MPAIDSLGRPVLLPPVIGPDPLRLADFALAPAWPDDPSAFALQQMGWIFRTATGGAGWEALPGPTQGTELHQELHLGNAPDGTRILFKITDRSRLLLYRSTDDGTSWQLVLEKPEDLPDGTHIKLVLSPDFSNDGVAFALLTYDGMVGGNVLLRSSDAGITWTGLDPAPGRALVDLFPSPAYSDDHILTLTTRMSFRPYWDQDRTPLPETPGLLVSTDNGDTWEPRLDPLINPDLIRVEASPDFINDGLLFGLTHEQLSYGKPPVRSFDAGVSWEPVAGLPLTVSAIAFSPNFAQDRLLLAASNRGLGHGSAACDLYRSRDGGDTWSRVAFKVSEADQFYACGSPMLLSAGGRVWALLHAHSWYWSTDAGQHWAPLPLPDGKQLQRVAPLPHFSDQPALIADSLDGQLWTMRLP